MTEPTTPESKKTDENSPQPSDKAENFKKVQAALKFESDEVAEAIDSEKTEIILTEEEWQSVIGDTCQD